jgi:tetratricopeptide (TPR) repeat protein
MIERFGPQWEVLLQIAELYNAQGQFGKAADALLQMVEVDPSNPDLKQTLAQALVRAQRYDEALAIYTDLLEVHPDNMDYAGEAATVHLLKKDYDLAAREFDKILSSDSVNVETMLRIGEVYFGQVEKDSTLLPGTRAIFERIRQKHPGDWRAYWFLGAIGALSHDDSLAVRNFRKVTELSSGNADAWVYLSSVFLEKNNFAEVVKILETAIRILPDDFRVNFFLGVAYSRVGRDVDAVKVLEHARQLNPRDINVISQLALVYDGLKRYEESDRLYEEALKIDPNNPLVLNNYGYSLADRNLQLERALTMATKAVEAQPENASYLDTIGWVYFRLGRYEEAEQYIKQAIERGDVSPVVYEHLGDIYYRMNDRERALEQWNIALKLDENNASLREKIARGTL